MDTPLATQRLLRLEGYVNHLREFRRVERRRFLEDPAVHLSAERLLQLALEAMLDVGNQLIAARALPAPEIYADIPRILGEAGVLPPDLAHRLVGAAKFRNVLVHEYADLDRSRVYDNLQAGLDDLAAFAQAVRTAAGL